MEKQLMEKQLMEYGVIYLKVCPPAEHCLAWLKHVHIDTNIIPTKIQHNIRELSNKINDKYASDIIIDMDTKLHPGCLTTKESVDVIASEIYNGFTKAISEYIDCPCVRCVYSIGKIKNINVESVHYLGHDQVMIKVGNFLDSSDEVGLFKI